MILNHEKAHAQQYHSIDILLIQLSCILFWFNPFIWLYNKDLKQNLEFIADKTAQKRAISKKSYQYTLLKTSIAPEQLFIVNNFYNSLLKKRITMLHKPESKKINQYKYALIAPLLIAFVFLFNTEVIAQKTIIETPEDPISVIGYGTSKEITSGNQDDIIAIQQKNRKTKFNITNSNSTSKKSPLIIIDGIENNMKTLQAIDPDNIDSISVLKDKTAIDQFGNKGKDGVIIVTTKSNKQLTINSDFVIKHNIELAENTSPVNSIVIINGKEPIYEIDGIESTKKEALKIKNSKIKKITALRGEPAIKKYGKKGKNGVMVISTKK